MQRVCRAGSRGEQHGCGGFVASNAEHAAVAGTITARSPLWKGMLEPALLLLKGGGMEYTCDVCKATTQATLLSAQQQLAEVGEALPMPSLMLIAQQLLDWLTANAPATPPAPPAAANAFFNAANNIFG